MLLSNHGHPSASVPMDCKSRRSAKPLQPTIELSGFLTPVKDDPVAVAWSQGIASPCFARCPDVRREKKRNSDSGEELLATPAPLPSLSLTATILSPSHPHSTLPNRPTSALPSVKSSPKVPVLSSLSPAAPISIAEAGRPFGGRQPYSTYSFSSEQDITLSPCSTPRYADGDSPRSEPAVQGFHESIVGIETMPGCAQSSSHSLPSFSFFQSSQESCTIREREVDGTASAATEGGHRSFLRGVFDVSESPVALQTASMKFHNFQHLETVTGDSHSSLPSTRSAPVLHSGRSFASKGIWMRRKLHSTPPATALELDSQSPARHARNVAGIERATVEPPVEVRRLHCCIMALERERDELRQQLSHAYQRRVLVKHLLYRVFTLLWRFLRRVIAAGSRQLC